MIVLSIISLYILCIFLLYYILRWDNEWEVKHMINCKDNHVKFVEMPGVWGHFAGGGINDDDTQFLDQHLRELLDA